MNRHTRRSLQHRAGQGDSNAVPSPRTPTPRLSHKKVDGCRSLQHDRDKPSVASLRRRSASLGIVIAINSELLIGFAGIRIIEELTLTEHIDTMAVGRNGASACASSGPRISELFPG